MDSLPEDLVVRILAKVGDALMLLDVLPLVCQRWRRLCRDPEAWAEVDVEWDGTEDDEDSGDDASSDDSDISPPLSVADTMRVLLRAPALRTLRLDWDFGEGELPKVMSALRRSRAVVRDAIQASQEVWTDTCHASRVALLDFLWRSRATLRAASMSLYLEEELESEVDSDADENEVQQKQTSHSGPLQDSEGRSALQVLASLQQLDWLDLDGTSNYPYAGELKKGLPNLRYLSVNEGGFADGVLPEPLLLDLIGNAKALRSLDLGSDYGRPAMPFLEMVGADQDFRDSVTPALLQCIAGCSDLTLLSGPDEVASVLSSLPHLKLLSVNAHPKTEEDEVAGRVGRVLQQCLATSAPLEEVQVFVDDVFGGREDDVQRCEWVAQQRAQCDAHVDQFKASRPDTSVAFYWE